MTAFTSREFNQDTGRAKKAAEKGPVFITDRGEARHVLLSIADFQRLASSKRKLSEMLSMPGLADIELDIERSREPAREVDLG